MGAAESNESAAFNGLASKLKRGLDMAAGEFRVSRLDLAERLSRFQKLQNRSYHDASSLEAGFAVADIGINRNVASTVHTGSLTDEDGNGQGGRWQVGGSVTVICDPQDPSRHEADILGVRMPV